MTVSHFRMPKSQTREFGERDRIRLSLGQHEEWRMGNTTFITAFIVIAAVLALLALVLR